VSLPSNLKANLKGKGSMKYEYSLGDEKRYMEEDVTLSVKIREAWMLIDLDFRADLSNKHGDYLKKLNLDPSFLSTQLIFQVIDHHFSI
jgi:hypothetical protein